MQPFSPLSKTNGLLHVISVEGLHSLCVICGVLGAVLMYAVFFVRRSARNDTRA